MITKVFSNLADSVKGAGKTSRCFPLLCMKRRRSSDAGGHLHLTASWTGGSTASAPMFLSGMWWLPTGRGASHGGCRAVGTSSVTPGQAQTGVCRVWCRTVLISWHRRVSSLCPCVQNRKMQSTFSALWYHCPHPLLFPIGQV